MINQENLLNNIKIEDVNYFFKGLRYSLGIPLTDMKKFGLNSGLFGNWECGLCKPNFENLLKVQKLIKKSGKTENELIQIGKLDISNTVEDISQISRIPLNILIRFVLSKFTSISGLKYIHKMKNEKISLSPKNKKYILDLFSFIKNNNQNPRRILLEMQKQMFNKEQNSKALKYEQIIGFQKRNNKFENSVYSIIEKFGEQTLKNALLSDESFNYITEVDVITKINGQTIVFLCKDTNYRKLINVKWDLIKKVENIKNLIKPDFIILVTSCDTQDNNYFSKNNIILINIKNLHLLRKGISYLTTVSNWQDNSKKNKTIKYGNDIKFILENKSLSAYQLASLLNMDGGYITRIIRENRKLTDNLRAKLKNIIETKLSNKELNLETNLMRLLNQDLFIIRYVREQLGIKIKDLANIINERPENLSSVERGVREIIKIKEKIIKYLQTFKEFYTYEKEAINELEKTKSFIKEFKHLISIRSIPTKGNILETQIYGELKKMGFKVIRNAVIGDDSVKFKKEVDLYAIKNKEEIIVECSSRKISIKLKDRISLFNEYKKLGIKKIIYINPELTFFAKEIFNKDGIVALKPEEFGEYLYGS